MTISENKEDAMRTATGPFEQMIIGFKCGPKGVVFVEYVNGRVFMGIVAARIEKPSLKDVVLPDGSSFDQTDWNVYSKEFEKIPVKIRALRLEVPVIIETLEGDMQGNPGDWLIQGVEGEFYPCKDSIFTKTYRRGK